MAALEHNVFFAFLIQALIISAIFAIAICWFSCIRKYFGLPCFADDEIDETSAKKVFPPDLPPTYHEADRFSQLEVSPTDVLYPPPAYSDLSLPPSGFEEVNLDPYSRRHSAPGHELGDSGPSLGSRDEYAHRNSIAVICDSVGPCGLVSGPGTLNPNEDQPASSSLTAKWLKPILSKVRQERRLSVPRRQMDHVYLPPTGSSHNLGDGFVSVDLQHPMAFDNLGVESVEVEEVGPNDGMRRASFAIGEAASLAPESEARVRTARSAGSLRDPGSAGMVPYVSHPHTVVVTIHGPHESDRRQSHSPLPPVIVSHGSS